MEIIIKIKVDGTDVSVSTEKSDDRNEQYFVSEYARFFDEGCMCWRNDPEYVRHYLRCVQDHFNEKLKRDGVVLLNEVYDALSIPRSKAGTCVGWVYDESSPIRDNYIDFGLYNTELREVNADFINGYTAKVLLDFNVDGCVFD